MNRNTLHRRLFPLGLWLAAFLLRVEYVFESAISDPTFSRPQLDARWHLQWALEIAQGGAAGAEAFFRAPLYPYFLGFLFRLFGQNLLAVRLVQAALGSVTVVLIYHLAVRLGGSRVGIAAGLIAAVYGPLIFFDAELLIPVLFLPLVVGALILALRARDRMKLPLWAVSGFLLGMACIARPNVLVFAPAVVAWIAWEVRDRRRWATAAATWVLAFLVPVLGVTARNAVVGGEAVLIASQGGANFYIGNNPRADGKTATSLGEIGAVDRKWTLYEDSVRLSARQGAERELGRPLTAGEVSRFWFGKGFAWIADDPIGWIGLTSRKAYFLANGHEIPSNRQIYRPRAWSRVLGVLLIPTPIGLPWGIVFPLAAAGLVWATLGRRGEADEHETAIGRRATHRLLFLYGIVYALTVIGFFVTARHRLPLVPILIPYAALALVAGWDATRHRQKRTRAVAAMVATFLAFVAVSNTGAFGVRDDVDLPLVLGLGMAYLESGKPAEAAGEFQTAVRDYPESDHAWFNLGVAQLQSKRYDEAVRSLESALRLNPRYAQAWSHLGNVYLARDQLDRAEELFRKAIAIDPRLAVAHANLSVVYYKRNDTEAFVQALEEAVRADPYMVDANLRLAVHYVESGQPGLAEPLLRNVLRIEPENRTALEYLFRIGARP